MLFKAILLLTIGLTVATAMVCPKNFCDKVECENLEESCLESNGQKIKEKASFCRCCDTCVKILGEGEFCMPIGEFLGITVTSECAEGLDCDWHSRKCIKED